MKKAKMIQVRKTVTSSSYLFSHHEIVEKGHVERLGGIYRDIVDAMLAAFPFVMIQKLIDTFLVLGPDMPGLGLDFFAGFHVDEEGVPVETKGPFHGVKDVKDDDFVFAMTEMFQGGEDLLGIIEEIGKYDDESPPFDPFGQIVEGVGNPGLTAAFKTVHGLEQDVEITEH